jgi:hypothetical protein
VGGTGVGRRIILNWIMQESVKLWTGFHCLRASLKMFSCKMVMNVWFYKFSDYQLIKKKTQHISYHILYPNNIYLSILYSYIVNISFTIFYIVWAG